MVYIGAPNGKWAPWNDPKVKELDHLNGAVGVHVRNWIKESVPQFFENDAGVKEDYTNDKYRKKFAKADEEVKAKAKEREAKKKAREKEQVKADRAALREKKNGKTKAATKKKVTKVTKTTKRKPTTKATTKKKVVRRRRK